MSQGTEKKKPPVLRVVGQDESAADESVPDEGAAASTEVTGDAAATDSNAAEPIPAPPKIPEASPEMNAKADKALAEGKAPPKVVSKQGERARVADPVERYLAEIRRYSILDRETERVLTRRFVQSQDARIAVRLITSNLRLVVKIALEYQSPWISLLDLIQEGNLGLLQSVRKFDPEKNIRLSSYAQWWIRAYILKYLMDNHRLVKVGTTQAQRKLFYNLQRQREKLERQGFKPTPRLLAKALSVRVKDIIEMETRLSSREVSLDAPIVEGDRDRLIDLLPANRPGSDELLAKRQISQHLLKRLAEFAETLSGRDAEIWTRRLMSEKPMTLQALGNLFGVSRERARQLESRVLKRLKKFLGEERHIVQHITFPLFS